MADYAVLIKPWAVYVKEWGFFIEQGGLTQLWGKPWIRIRASSIEDAREKGRRLRA